MKQNLTDKVQSNNKAYYVTYRDRSDSNPLAVLGFLLRVQNCSKIGGLLPLTECTYNAKIPSLNSKNKSKQEQ